MQIDQSLQLAMTQLEHSTAELQALLRDNAYQFAQAYSLPDVLKGEEGRNRLHIPVEHHGDFNAFTLAVAALGRFRAPREHSTKSTYKLPGVIVTEADGEQLQARVDQVNRDKLEIKRLIATIPGEQQRAEILVARFPGLILLQVYRQVQLISEPVYSLSFTLSPKTLVSKVTRSGLLEHLLAQKAQCPDWVDPSDWHHMLNQEITGVQKLQRQDADKVRFRRLAPPQPLVNITLQRQAGDAQRQGKRIRFQKPALLPLLLCNQQDTVHCKPLRGYDADERVKRYRKSGNRQYVYQEIRERIGLYFQHH